MSFLRTFFGSLLNENEFAALKAFADQLRISRNHRKGKGYVRAHYAGRTDLRVQFGCGPARKEGWVNTDLYPGPWARPDFVVDVSRTLPFEDGSAAEIYSEHMFEHLAYPKVVFFFLDECFRTLRPGGKMTIGAPDVEPMIAAYLEGRDRLCPPSPEESHYCKLGHALERLNFQFHQADEHKFLYSFDFLARLLADRGFTGVERRDFDPAQDSEHRRAGTLYAVCRKPA